MASEIIMRTVDKERDTLEMLVPPRDQINSNTVITGNFCHFTYGALALVEHYINLNIDSSCMYIFITVANSNRINPDSLTFNDYNVIFVSNDGVTQNSTRHTFQQKPESQCCACYENVKYINWWSIDWKFEEHPWNNNTHSIKFVFNVKPTSEGLEQNLRLNMTDLLMDDFLSDLKILCENETLPAHRSVLTNRSPKLRAMLERDWKETQKGRLVIESIKLEVLKELLRFMYTGNVDFKPDHLVDLFKAADEYLMTDLKEKCIELIIKEICLENALDIYAAAVIHDCKPLHDVAVKFLTLNKKLIADEKLVEFCKRFPDLMCKLFKL